MPNETSRLARGMSSACAIVVAASCGVLALAEGRPGPLVTPSHQTPQAGPVAPPLVVDAIVVDKKGAPVDDMRASDFTVSVDGKPRTGVAIARLYRGPGAAGLVMARQATPPGEMRPLAEPSRVVLLVVDQGSFLPGDERRARLIIENCLGLLGLGDRIMLITLPDLVASEALSVDRDSIRRGLGKVRPLRASYTATVDAPPEGALKPVDPVARADERAGGDPSRPENYPGVSALRPEALMKLDDILPGGSATDTETLSPPAAKAHALAMLDGLRQVVERLGQVPGGKTVLLLSAGLIGEEAIREMRAVETAAAASFTRIYTIQVPTPSPRFAEMGRAGLLALARNTGGSLVTLIDKPAQALQRMAAELSFSYLLMLAPLPADVEAGLRSVSVRTRRKDVTIRASSAVRPGFLPPELVPTPPAPPLAPAAGAVPPMAADRPAAADSVKRPARRDPALAAVLARVSDYADNYGRELSAVVAEEVYEQKATRGAVSAGAAAAQSPTSRRLVSDFLLVKVPGADGWLPFRDVFEVDGVQVRDRDDRLKKLFLEAPPEKAVENAKTIWDESARYNIGVIHRNVNVPTLPLMFVDSRFVPRFEFSRRGEPTVGGIRAWEIEYREVARPTIIKTRGGEDVPASGTLWVEPVSGRILRTLMKAAGATITVTYEPRAESLGLWLPVKMQESYVYSVGRIQAIATYSKFRRFQVFTEEKIKPPKEPR